MPKKGRGRKHKVGSKEYERELKDSDTRIELHKQAKTAFTSGARKSSAAVVKDLDRMAVGAAEARRKKRKKRTWE